jgi:hypothetical protein
MGFGGILRQSTAVDVLIGPFVDDANGNDEETTLTISQGDVLLSKNGQPVAQKNDNTACAHDADGFYNCELDATDTNTVGQLTLYVHEAGALAVRHDYQVIEEAVYDILYAASATGAVPVASIAANAITATAINADAFTAAKFAADVTTELQSGLATAAELAKVPKSDGTASWNATALAALQSEANDALVAYDPPTKAELDAAVANVSVDEIQASALADLFNTDSGTTYASAVAGSVVSEIADNAGGSALTEAGIADAVWDELIAGHAGVGSTGEALSDAGGAGTPPTVAEIRAEMDANSTKLADILTDTGTTLQAELDAIQAAVITNAAGADIAADIIALKAETASILEDTGTTLQAELDAIQAAVITNAAGTDIAADIIAIKAQTAAIETDTAEIGAAGAGLTNINLPNQTMDIVGNITGNLSGSVGSVTGAVGSVTAEVNANVQKINDVTLTGDGSGTPWGPV